MFWNKYPYTDFSQLNLDWILKQIIQLKEKIDSIDVSKVIQDMIDSGAFDDLIDDDLLNALFGELVQSKTWKVNIFSEIASIDDLAAGDTVTTSGYATIGDGGAALYYINTSVGLPVGALYAYPVDGNAISWGLKGDGTDETASFENVVSMVSKLDLAGLDIVLGSSVLLHSNLEICNGSLTAKNNIIVTNGLLNANTFSNVKIIGVTFNGGTQANDFYSITAINSTDFRLEDCVFNAGIGYRIRLSGSDGAIVRNCKCFNVTGVVGNPGGFIYMQGGKNAIVDNVEASNLMDHVVYFDGSVPVSDVTVRNIFAKDIGIAALTSAAVVVLYGEVDGFLVENVHARDVKTGISCSYRNGKFPTNGTISNNDISADLNAIDVIGTNDTEDIEANIIVCNNVVSSENQDGLSARSTKRVMICNNIVKSAGRWGVEFSSQRYSVISGNVVYSADLIGIFNGARDTIDTVNKADYNVIKDNVVYSADSGIASTDWAANTVIMNNYVFAAATMKYNPGSAVNLFGCNYNDGDVRSITFGTAPPTINAHTAGDIVIDSTGATDGWKCTASGTPGTWVAR